MIRITDLEQYACSLELTLRDAVHRLDQSAHLFQIVVDGEGKLAGTLTDGDVRRAMLRGVALDAPVSDAMNRSPIAGRDGAERGNLDKLATVGLAAPFLPILDGNDAVREIMLATTMPDSGIHALVMAGGSGRRLGALTQSVPKPLLPVGGKPILEHVLTRLESAGVSYITVSVHYLAEQIEQFLAARDNQARVVTLFEDSPLGTAGALGRLAPPVSGAKSGANVLVVNGDIVTQVDFATMRDFHDRHGYDGTIAVIRHDTDIPFGVVRYDGDGNFERIDEKPVLSHFVAAGVYLLSPAFAGLVAREEAMDMNELLNLGREVGLSIGLFPIHEYWVDVGRPDDLDRADRDHTGHAGHAANDTEGDQA